MAKLRHFEGWAGEVGVANSVVCPKTGVPERFGLRRRYVCQHRIRPGCPSLFRMDFSSACKRYAVVIQHKYKRPLDFLDGSDQRRRVPDAFNLSMKGPQSSQRRTYTQLRKRSV